MPTTVMKCSLVIFFLIACLLPAGVFPQTKSQSETSRSGAIKICRELDIPEGYVIVAFEPSSVCPNGAYVLKKEATQFPLPNNVDNIARPRPRRVNNSLLDFSTDQKPDVRQPVLQITTSPVPLDAPETEKVPSATSLDEVKEVGEGDVVRIETNLVTVPVSVMDRDGRFISDLRRDQFSVFENGAEQRVVHFEPTEKPFTVALLLDTSGSTFFHLWEIKEAAIAFAKQLRPQDRVLVVTFDKLVMLLTEATSDAAVVTQVIERNAMTGFSTRLYDAIDLVIRKRLNKISGRKAIVLFTDGVDTSSYSATYKSTLSDAEELDALIYPVQYDTRDFWRETQSTTGSSGSNYPIPGSTEENYRLADKFLRQLADKSGARLYQANDRTELGAAFSKIAGELRSQYTLGYYPQTPVGNGERRTIKVRVDQPNLAVRAREGYRRQVR